MAGIPPSDLPRDDAEAVFRENLIFASRMTAESGIRILIEPLNPIDVPGYFLTSVEQAAALLETISRGRHRSPVRPLSSRRTGGDLVEPFERFRAQIAHVQIAGAPERHEPDRGDPRILEALGALDRLGYDGHVGCEYVPAGDTIAGLAWARTWLEDKR